MDGEIDGEMQTSRRVCISLSDLISCGVGIGMGQSALGLIRG